MTIEQFTVKEIDPLTIEEPLVLKYFELGDILRTERDPDEPAPPIELRMKYFRDKHPYQENFQWWILDNVDGEEKVIGTANVGFSTDKAPDYESNKHISFMNINVHPDYRQQGLGTQMLRKLVEKAKGNDLITTVFAGAERDAGHSFCKKFGGKFSQEGAENRLRLPEVDWKMIDEWIAEGENKAGKEGVTIQFFEDVPEDIIEEYTKIYTETMNQQPLGEFDGEIKDTPESRRTNENRNKEKGMKWFTMISREKDGTISGLTEILFHPQLNHKAFQALTGVKDDFRGRGLGKWLKAKMLKWFVEEHPTVKYITTGNDSTNAPMLSINNRMGFKKFKGGTSYTFELNKLDAHK